MRATHLKWRQGTLPYWPVLLLSIFSFFITGAFFLRDGALYWDNARIFSQFRDNLHSLNRFGEMAWWFPHNQFGYPGYYHSLLGIPSCLDPAFMVLGLIAWASGRLGIFFSRYQPIYVFYFAGLVPLLFLSGLRMFCNRVFQTKQAVLYAIILGAFSPGVMLQVSDIGYLEPVAYSLFFAAVFLDYQKDPSLQNFWKCVGCCGVLALGFHHVFLYWNLLSIPLFVFLVTILRKGSWYQNLKQMLASQSKLRWGFFLLLMAVAVSPNFITLSQGRDLVRTSIGNGLEYSFERMSPGNPLEFFLASLPGFGFNWGEGHRWTMIPNEGVPLNHYYLGLLCLPLAITGIFFAKRRIRIPLLVFIVGFFLMNIMSGLGPFTALVLWLKSPLRSANHFSDTSFKGGAFLLLLLAAAAGWDTLLTQNKQSHKKILLGTFLLSFSVAVFIYIQTFGRHLTGNFQFGFLLVLGVVTLSVLIWLLRCQREWTKREVAQIFLLLTLVDTATFSFFFIRSIVSSTGTSSAGRPAYAVVDETPAANGIGLLDGGSPHYYSNFLLMPKSLFQLTLLGAEVGQWPRFALYHRVRPIRNMGHEITSGMDLSQGLPLAVETLEDPAFSKYFPSIKSNPKQSYQLGVINETYNKLHLRLKTDLGGVLFIKDGYSPYWRATSAGEQIEIGRALFNFKALPLSQGKQDIILTYRPPWIVPSIFLAYSVLLLSFGMWLFNGYENATRKQHQNVFSSEAVPGHY